MKPKILVAVVLALCMTACGSKKPPLTPLLMKVYVQPDPSANNGAAFWMVIKEVDENQFHSDTYDQIEATFLEDEWGPEVIGAFPIVPGENRQITVTRPSYRPAGFYFLFTDPKEHWKLLLKQPVGTKYDLHIGKYKASVSKRMSSW